VARVTQTEVRTTSQLDAVYNAAIDAAIVVATTLVDEHLLTLGYSAATLKNIELYLACHFAVLSAEKGPLAANRIGEVQERYHDIYGKGLNASRFGQQAILLDSSGKLAELSAKAEQPNRQALFSVIEPAASEDEPLA